MTKHFIRLPNGGSKEIYCYLFGDDESTIQFVDQEYNDIKSFFGSEILDYIDLVDEENKLLSTVNIYQKVAAITCTTDVITEYEKRLVQEEYDQTVTEYDDVPKYRTTELIIVKLAKPSIREEVENIKSVVGIVNTNSMTLEEFRDYYKEQIGKQCTAAIESGLAIETSLGNQHFSYTIEDQSNVKDLVMTAELTDFTLPLPYHANGELCTLYPATDILKIYMSLSVNKTYHTTY